MVAHPIGGILSDRLRPDQAGNNYTVGLVLLCVTAAVAFVVTLLRIPHEAPVARGRKT